MKKFCSVLLAFAILFLNAFSLSSCSMGDGSKGGDESKDDGEYVTFSEFCDGVEEATGKDPSDDSGLFTGIDSSSNVTREDVAWISLSLLELDKLVSDIELEDIELVGEEYASKDSLNGEGDPYLLYIRNCARLSVDLGLLKLKDNKFDPNGYITRGELKDMLSVMKELHGTLADGENEGIVYKDGVIVLSPDTVEDEGDTLRIEKNAVSQGIKVGDVLVIDGGGSYKVKSVSSDAGSYYVSYSSPELHEFLKKLDVKGDAVPDVANFEPAPGVQVIPNDFRPGGSVNLSPLSTVSDSGELKAEIPLKVAFSVPAGDCKLSLDIGLEAVSMEYDYDIDFTGTSTDIKKAKVVFRRFTDVTLSLTTTDGEQKNSLPTGGIPSRIPLGTLPFVGAKNFGCVAGVNLVWDAEGSFGIEFTCGEALGIEIINNRLFPVAEYDFDMIDIKLAGEFKVGLQLEVLVEIYKFDLFSFKIDGGYGIEGEYDHKHVGSKNGRNFYCVDTTYAPYLEITLWEGTLIDKWLDCESKITFLENNDDNPWRKQGLHIENFSTVVKECTYGPTATVNFSMPNFKEHYSVEEEEGGKSTYSWSDVKTTVYVYDCSYIGPVASVPPRLEFEVSGTSGSVSFSFDKLFAYGDCAVRFSVGGKLKITTVEYTDDGNVTHTHVEEDCGIYSSKGALYSAYEGETVTIVLEPDTDTRMNSAKN